VSPVQPIVQFRKALQFLFKSNSHAAPLIARVMPGIVMFPHGAQKMLGWFGGNGFTGTMHIPAGFAFAAILTEFASALGLIAGLFSRVAAFGIATLMVVAVLTTTAANGFFMNWYGNQKFAR
jgi:putative oxidoreductase